MSTPTILAGQNDGGKSAVLAALAFLVGNEQLAEDDRTYELAETAGGEAAAPCSRCASTWIEGLFTLDAWEQEEFGLPENLRVRRSAAIGKASVLECWAPLPDDERLRDPSQLSLAEVRAAAKELLPELTSIKRPDIEPALRKYGLAHASTSAWVPAPKGLERRLPRLLPFDGKATDPDGAVKTALMGRYQTHMADATLQGHLQTIESDIKARLQSDAKSMCEHIRTRCDDLTEVFVEPEVSFSHGLRGAPLRISRAKGEAVSLGSSGLGSSRRISLAIWEWNSQLLSTEEFGDIGASTGSDTEEESAPPPVQTIVIYDEPDTHLDYGHQRKIMQLVRDQGALPHVNVIVATHSMNLIDGVDIADVVHLRLEDGRTVIERLGADTHGAIDAHLGQIATAVGLRNSVLLHERCFLAVEGDTEQRVIPVLFRLSEGLSLQSAGIALWACFNNEGALHLARYLVEHGRSVMLMVDADSRNLPKGLFKDARLQQFFGDSVADHVRFVGEPDAFNELEELFPDDLWAAVANDVWPKQAPWTAADFTAHRPGKKFSKEVLNMLREKSPAGPSGKPDMMYELVSALTSPDQVPAQLREIFGQLRKLATG
ncbi:TOPRIM nucleotidyl transferase/hydrolase domain-containing protein [Streptomyces sp. CBMA152]|uniref:TOPRIM nucleotidyl transferase/hydrolase domain-containing protein n=1 Tax=Streptomyces sp. CBMA152 TaxID=1896312 RepID=UPI0037D9E26B